MLFFKFKFISVIALKERVNSIKTLIQNLI